MRKIILLVALILGIVFIFGIAKPPEENYYTVGNLKVFVGGEKGQCYEYILLSEKPLNIDWTKMMNSRIEIVIPYEKAKDRTTIVYRIQ